MYIIIQFINLSFCTAHGEQPGPTTASERSALLTRALSPYVPKTGADLAGHLARSVVYHSPNDVLALEKPYGGFQGYR
jgi:hypothetical protein